MASPLRIEYEHAFYHVMNRGAGRDVIFQNDVDHMNFLTICGDYRLKEIADTFGLAHYGGVSRAIYHVSEAIKIDEQLLNRLNNIINRFDP